MVRTTGLGQLPCRLWMSMPCLALPCSWRASCVEGKCASSRLCVSEVLYFARTLGEKQKEEELFGVLGAPGGVLLKEVWGSLGRPWRALDANKGSKVPKIGAKWCWQNLSKIYWKCASHVWPKVDVKILNCPFTRSPRIVEI